MLRKTNVELENLTPELSKTFATMEKLPGERPLKETRLKFFADHIAEGTFIDPSWSVGICKADGKKYRLDGQHTSTILASTPPEKFPQNKLATIVTYEFDDVLEDAAILFDTFDNPASARSNQDMMGVYRAGHDDMNELSNSLCVAISNGIAVYESQQKGGRILPTRVRGLYFQSDEYRNFARWIKNRSDNEGVKNDWLFNKAGIIAEMLDDWKFNEAVATEFWTYVLNENHTDPDHITRELAEDLKRWRVKQERRSQVEYRSRAQKSWKRYRKEIELDKAA